jgi:hypothetical protein
MRHRDAVAGLRIHFLSAIIRNLRQLWSWHARTRPRCHRRSPRRQDRRIAVLDLSGADSDAMLEITSAQDMIAAQEDPDLLAMVRLAIHRDRLGDRSTELPRFVTLWARLGRFARAET